MCADVAADAGIAVRGLHKRYGGTEALAGVDLHVAVGGMHGLVGPNGAGKTTLLRVLLGLVRPDTGEAWVLGRPATQGRDDMAGFVDTPAHYPYLTGRRNLELLQRLDGRGRPGAVGEALARTGLEAVADSKVAGWSTGMRQRLGLAAALLRQPLALVVDEPTSGLDPKGVADVHALLRELATKGTTVLLSSHDMAEVAALCSEVTVLSRGTVRFTGSSAALRAILPPPVHLLRTSDDEATARLVRASGLTAERHRDGLHVAALDTDALVLALTSQRIAVRTLVEAVDPLTRAFLDLTA